MYPGESFWVCGGFSGGWPCGASPFGGQEVRHHKPTTCHDGVVGWGGENAADTCGESEEAGGDVLVLVLGLHEGGVTFCKGFEFYPYYAPEIGVEPSKVRLCPLVGRPS